MNAEQLVDGADAGVLTINCRLNVLSKVADPRSAHDAFKKEGSQRLQKVARHFVAVNALATVAQARGLLLVDHFSNTGLTGRMIADKKFVALPCQPDLGLVKAVDDFLIRALVRQKGLGSMGGNADEPDSMAPADLHPLKLMGSQPN